MAVARKPKRNPRTRLNGILASQRRRAAAHMQSVEYSVAVLEDIAAETSHCPYCGDPITALTMQFDHLQPVSRNGLFSASNLQGVCARCNRRKGPLSDAEYRMLVDMLDAIADAVGDTFVKSNVLKRLAAARF